MIVVTHDHKIFSGFDRLVSLWGEGIEGAVAETTSCKRTIHVDKRAVEPIPMRRNRADLPSKVGSAGVDAPYDHGRSHIRLSLLI